MRAVTLTLGLPALPACLANSPTFAPMHRRTYSAPAALQSQILAAFHAEMQRQFAWMCAGLGQLAVLPGATGPPPSPWGPAPLPSAYLFGHPAVHYQPAASSPAFATPGPWHAPRHGRSHSAPET
ncbi:hypothetical protein AURDEDRAFT_171523 [Auricularia subglabra TFB-10046 SS5]|nr:hypothetical protein AURDEDRAFT_171523 [Auricularia subglabra TFB-10046 SS5]